MPVRGRGQHGGEEAVWGGVKSEESVSLALLKWGGWRAGNAFVRDTARGLHRPPRACALAPPPPPPPLAPPPLPPCC